MLDFGRCWEGLFGLGVGRFEQVFAKRGSGKRDPRNRVVSRRVPGRDQPYRDLLDAGGSADGRQLGRIDSKGDLDGLGAISGCPRRESRGQMFRELAQSSPGPPELKVLNLLG